ncbi:MAG: rhomboid family intramembrane serine protease [Gammaproteobacteria bacterium]|nr:rhomboid family intramembrane serine protease [Gammaproteobacteria bacterium]NNJ96862.1 rhomboid family intramembrane serine protease [Gammaproteobacteria bacterium]
MFPIHDDTPTRLTPYFTYGVIIACVLIFIWQLSLGDLGPSAIYSFGVIPAVLLSGKSLPVGLDILPAWMTIFSSMFLHGGWMHLIGNMLYLWVFSNNVEDAMGHKRFIVFYLMCGLLAAMTQAMLDPASEIPMIGASGAVSGVLGAYLLLHPHARILVIIPIGFLIYTPWIPAFWVLGFWFVLQIFNSWLSASDAGGIAYGAHMGGFVAGMLLIPLFKYRNVPLFAPASTERRVFRK